MDNKRKFLQKIGKKQAPFFIEIFQKISTNEFENLDIKKLKGHENIFRIRKGKWRIVFVAMKKENLIIEISTRGNIY